MTQAQDVKIAWRFYVTAEEKKFFDFLDDKGDVSTVEGGANELRVGIPQRKGSIDFSDWIGDDAELDTVFHSVYGRLLAAGILRPVPGRSTGTCQPHFFSENYLEKDWQFVEIEKRRHRQMRPDVFTAVQDLQTTAMNSVVQFADWFQSTEHGKTVACEGLRRTVTGKVRNGYLEVFPGKTHVQQTGEQWVVVPGFEKFEIEAGRPSPAPKRNVGDVQWKFFVTPTEKLFFGMLKNRAEKDPRGQWRIAFPVDMIVWSDEHADSFSEIFKRLTDSGAIKPVRRVPNTYYLTYLDDWQIEELQEFYVRRFQKEPLRKAVRLFQKESMNRKIRDLPAWHSALSMRKKPPAESLRRALYRDVGGHSCGCEILSSIRDDKSWVAVPGFEKVEMLVTGEKPTRFAAYLAKGKKAKKSAAKDPTPAPQPAPAPEPAPELEPEPESVPAPVEEPVVPVDDRRVRAEAEMEKLEQRLAKLEEYLELLKRQRDMEADLFG